MIESIVDGIEVRASIPEVPDALPRITARRTDDTADGIEIPDDGIDEPAEGMNETDAGIEIPDDRMNIIDAMTKEPSERTDQPAKGGEEPESEADAVDTESRRIHVTTTKTTKKPLVALVLPKPVPALITYATRIVTCMTGNAAFPTPVPALTVVTAAINTLQTAETQALARTKGAVTTRNEQRAALVALLVHLKAYIQVQADANAENAASIIESAGVAVRKAQVRKPRVFAAKPGTNSGTVVLITAAAGRRASYEWQYSTDGGKTWVTVPSTLQAKTTVTGLTPGSNVEFRLKTVVKTGESDWSAPVSLLVK